MLTTVRLPGHHIIKKHKLQIEKVHTKIIPELREFDYEIRLKKLNLWSLEERKNRADIVGILKRSMKCPLYCSKLFQLRYEHRTRGHTVIIKENRRRT